MPSTIDLGFQVPDYSSMGQVSTPSPAKPEMKTAYPSMTIPGNAGLARALKPGQSVTATVTFKVTEICVRERDDGDDGGNMESIYGNGTRVELEAQSMTFDGVNVDQSDNEPDAASAFKKFMSKKGKTGNYDDTGDDGAK